MSRHITSAAAAARESARTTTGKFGHQFHDEADIDLTGKRPPSTKWPYELGDGTFLIRENVTVDAGLRSVPSYRDPYSSSGLHSPHISGGPRRLMLEDLADHLQSLGGGSMRLHSNGGSAMPSYADVSFQDPELGQANARFRLATGLTMECMSTASGTDLTGHPQWEAMTRVRRVGFSNSGQNPAAGLPPRRPGLGNPPVLTRPQSTRQSSAMR